MQFRTTVFYGWAVPKFGDGQYQKMSAAV